MFCQPAADQIRSVFPQCFFSVSPVALSLYLCFPCGRISAVVGLWLKLEMAHALRIRLECRR
jgi:hypothetical protein